MTGQRGSFIAIMLIAACAASPAMAQPGTDIYLLDLQALQQDQLVLLRVTEAPGYENQPHFSADSRRLYFTRQVGDQTDIFSYELASARIDPVTDTPQSEYSPTAIPRQSALSVIRVEDDGRQRLWSIPLNGEPAELLLENIEPVGYHAWAAPRIVLLFVLGDPVTLQLAGPAGVGLPLAENIGRALVAVPGSTEVAYVQKDEGEKRWSINAYDYAVDRHRFMASTLPGREDFTIAPDGSLWMGDGPRLYHWTASKPTWTPRTDLSQQGLINLTRLAVSPDGQWLAVVTDESAPPPEPPLPPPDQPAADGESEDGE